MIMHIWILSLKSAARINNEKDSIGILDLINKWAMIIYKTKNDIIWIYIIITDVCVSIIVIIA